MYTKEYLIEQKKIMEERYKEDFYELSEEYKYIAAASIGMLNVLIKNYDRGEFEKCVIMKLEIK